MREEGAGGGCAQPRGGRGVLTKSRPGICTDADDALLQMRSTPFAARSCCCRVRPAAKRACTVRVLFGRGIWLAEFFRKLSRCSSDAPEKAWTREGRGMHESSVFRYVLRFRRLPQPNDDADEFPPAHLPHQPATELSRASPLASVFGVHCERFRLFVRLSRRR